MISRNSPMKRSTSDKVNSTDATFVIFSNGKVICCGAKKTREIHQAVEKLKG
ncbi:hypothetical protein DRO69_03065 [Candidatus Bathyarchaeota archaeon]|nr:MAG: hypothetical protein DRO69_03065 [Candidatus Bathyarchaeota archaeon]